MLPLRLRRYGIAKLANVLFAAELQRRLDAEHPSQCSRILCMSVHPGSVGTDGAMSLFPWPIRALLRVAVFVPPNEGAWPSLFAAAAPEVRENEEKFAGAYMEPPAGSVAKPHVQARGETGVRMARELWQATEEGVSAYLGGNWRAGIGEGH